MANPRIEIPLVVLNELSPYNPVSGAECTITKRGTEEKATVYSDSGATNTTLTNPLTSDSAGRISGWLERGIYDCTVKIPGRTPYVEPFDAAPAKDESVDTAWIKKEAVTGEKVSSAIKDAAAGTASLRTLGAGSTQAAAGNDSRLSDERTPKANSVTAAKIENEAVETAKIKKEAVTNERLGPEAVETAKIKNLNVTEGKLADGAVTSRKFKPTTGIVTASGNLTCGESFADITGTTLEITPAVASILEIIAIFDFSNVKGLASATINLDGADQAKVARLEGISTAPGNATITQVYRLALNVAAHTIKMRGKLNSGSSATIASANTQYFYRLTAS